MYQRNIFTTSALLLLCAFVLLTGCSGNGKGGRAGNGGSSDTAVISGKVMLSGTVLSSEKTSGYLNALYGVPAAKPGTKGYREMSGKVPVSGLNKVLFAAGDAQSLSNATVELFDADHPEWLYPVATGITGSDGSYQLSAMTNAAKNEGAAYRDGDPIPAGKYTLVAYKTGLGQKPVVAVQTVVFRFEGDVPDVDFEVVDNDAPPTVISILGLAKNTDGTPTWGGAAATYPANSAMQITFSMPMTRDYLSAIAIESADGGTVPTGKWTLSADWLTASFYLDEGQTLAQGRTYKITIYGEDDTTNHAKAVNVYGNPIDQTSTCTFVAAAEDTTAPTVQWNRPTESEMSGLVDVTQPFRIESDELLDVNSLSLQSTTEPGIGVKPGVLFLGKNQSGKYVYEFDLGEPLQLDTYYSVTVEGGKDLAGHDMNVLTGSITTYGAAETAGIDPSADSEKQNLQAAVKAVFGKWVRAMSDRNLAQFQNMMSGEFYFEYDVSSGIDTTYDINRDGRYSFSEFSGFMEKNAFVNWAYCGTTITGSISSTAASYINIYSLYEPPQADFDFKLSASNTANSQKCSDSAPKETLYATLQYKNGSWKIVRASSGIDTRDKTVSSPDIITADFYQINNADSMFFSSSSGALSDGAKLDGVPNSPTAVHAQNIALKYEWEAVAGVASYVLVVMDQRNPDQGVAVAFPSTVTSARSDKDWVTALGGTDVSTLFGLASGGTNSFSYVEGGKYYWEVIGLETTASADVPDQNENVILQDIKAASFVREFNVAGVYAELLVQVKPTAGGSEISYSELFQGYDLGSSGTANLAIYTPNKSSSGTIQIQGSKWESGTLSFDSDAKASYDLTLYKGDTWVEVCDSGNSTANPPKPQLCKSFSITTTGGLDPVIQITMVTDNTGAVLTGNASQYYTAAPEATQITIWGSVSDSSVSSLYFNLWNETGAYSSSQALVSSGLFNITMDIYQGDNWINIWGSGITGSYSEYVGVYAETGAVWVPPISITNVSESTLRGNYTSSSDWDASPGSDYKVTISGKLKTPQDGSYYVSSDGGYVSGTLTSLSNGSFSLTVEIYDGWNYVSLYDSTGAWYGVNIYTEDGKPVIKPTITKVDGADYSGSGSATVSGCVAALQGTAVVGDVTVNVNGYGKTGAGYSSFWESQTVDAKGLRDPGDFTVYVPVASGTGSYTYVDIYDKDYKWTSVKLSTTADCTYSEPTISFTTVKNALGYELYTDVSGYYQAGTTNKVTISGTSNRPGYAVRARLNTCSVIEETGYSSTSGSGPYYWNVSINVFGQLFNSGYNDIYLNNGTVVPVYSANSNAGPPPPMAIRVKPGVSIASIQCNSMDMSTGSATGVTIVGKTSAPDGTGHYTDTLNGNHTFLISQGTFSIQHVNVYQGYNYIYLYDTDYNYYSLTIESSNGVAKPQFVTISGPGNNDPVSGDVPVYGTITNPISPSGYEYDPSTVYAYVYNDVTKDYTWYSSDIYDQITYNYKSISYDGTNFDLIYPMGGNTGSYSYINVYAYDTVNGINHGHAIYVNGTGSDYYYKPGAKPAIEQSSTAEIDRMKREVEITSKTR